MNRFTTLQQIQKCLNSVKELIGQVLDATVQALSELQSKIPSKTSELENDAGFLTASAANITYDLSRDGNSIVLSGSDNSEYKVAYNIITSDSEPENQMVGDYWITDYK